MPTSTTPLGERRATPENTRESFRKEALDYFQAVGLIVVNPDEPGRSTNSSRYSRQVTEEALELLRKFGTPAWSAAVARFLASGGRFVAREASRRVLTNIPLETLAEAPVRLSVQSHSQLIADVIYEFGPRFAPGGTLLYVGDTKNKWESYFDLATLAQLGVTVASRGAKMPDVVIFNGAKNWLLLIEAVTSRGPINQLRKEELGHVFRGFGSGLVFVTAFPDRATMARDAARLAWETECWIAEDPDHLIHFDGQRFLGPYADHEKAGP